MQNFLLLALANPLGGPAAVPAAPFSIEPLGPRPWSLAPVALAPAPSTFFQTPSADARRRWYVGLHGGYGLLDDGDFSRSLSGVSEDGDASFSGGLASGFAIGYEFAPRWALEFDFTYRSNDVDEITVGGDRFDAGDYASVAWMLNAKREFGDGALRPYLGLGLGFQQEVDIDLQPTGAEAEADFVFAWQLTAGASYQVSERWRVFAEARLLAATDAALDVAGSSGDTFEADYDHLGLFVGARWSF